MPLPIKDVLDMIVNNTLKKGAPISLPDKAANGWARELDIPKGGETILYTSILYQMVPYAITSTKLLEELESGAVGGVLLKLGRMVSSVFDVSKLASKVSEEEVSAQHEVLKSIARLLRGVGVSFGYLYEDEMYAGTLLYDLGRDDDFAKHAEKIVGIFKKHGVKKVITVDPHTTHILRDIYPKFVDGFDLEIENYLEILAKKDPEPKKKLNTCVTIQDPCYYARFLGIIEEPRTLLTKAGVEIKEPSRTKRLTFCCGGPIESLSPRLSREVAALRVKDLRNACENSVTMCPFCYASLSRASAGQINVRDISLYLYEAYGGE